jgi:hypothetical protein
MNPRSNDYSRYRLKRLKSLLRGRFIGSRNAVVNTGKFLSPF